MRIETDCLAIGSGIAGLFFALKAAEHASVALVTKSEPRESNTRYAQGGIASVMDLGDSFEMHIRDTLEAGAGLCNERVVEVCVREGPQVVRELIELGARFSRSEEGELTLGREGGHSRSRIVHADDFTGREVERALLAAVESHPQVRIFPHHLALDLIVDAGRCRGAWILDTRSGAVHEFAAPLTLLATGGAGQIYRHTTNPAVASGDGIAMAYRAGACVGNLEFMQFHPTMLYQPEGESFLISEAVRGYGGVLINHRGEAFVDACHPLGSLATRDIVARAIVDELKSSGREYVYLDVRHKEPEETRGRFPNIYHYCMERNIDITRAPIPVVPAAHYMCGGVVTDLHGATQLRGLYASGEVALTGLHGANRLASNSLLEALVFARRAWVHARDYEAPAKPRRVAPAAPGKGGVDEAALARLRVSIRRCMWEEVGIVRTDAGLARACRRLETWAGEAETLYREHPPCAALIEVRNTATVALLAAQAARMRRESRGGHFNSDHPERDDCNWAHDTLMHAAVQPGA